jgi:hypothetical protein
MQVPQAVVKNSSRYLSTKAFYDMGTALDYNVLCDTYLKLCGIDDGLDTDVHDLSGTYLELPKDELDRDSDDQCYRLSLKRRVKRKRSSFVFETKGLKKNIIRLRKEGDSDSSSDSEIK